MPDDIDVDLAGRGIPSANGVGPCHQQGIVHRPVEHPVGLSGCDHDVGVRVLENDLEFVVEAIGAKRLHRIAGIGSVGRQTRPPESDSAHTRGDITDAQYVEYSGGDRENIDRAQTGTHVILVSDGGAPAYWIQRCCEKAARLPCRVEDRGVRTHS
ncbi:hypothetical protein SDC9_144372 [bioreactor metagenome]|uniref:Uncharacterized protein n=1 Tax=bioreactor metagenome TaxID=1076179 RepID=A0A645E6N3_9ZZZZ